MLRTFVIVAAVSALLVGGYVFWQYRTVRPVALDAMPVYSTATAVAVEDIPHDQRNSSESQLREIAARVRPGYHVTEERFLASNYPLTWDAIRHHVTDALHPSGYELIDDDWSQNHQVVYSLYCHTGWLRDQFNRDMIVAAGMVKTPVRTKTDTRPTFMRTFGWGQTDLLSTGAVANLVPTG